MNKNILKLIFENRVDDISKITEADINYLNSHHTSSITFDDIKNYILSSDNLDKDLLIYNLESYLCNIHFDTGFYCEKYYMHGFSDAINLYNECKKFS